MKKVLYIHHGRGIGGAPLSLLFLIRKLDRSKYYPIVLCLYESPAADLYRNEGVETHIAQGIHELSHTNLTWHSQVWYRRPWDLVKQVLAFWPSVWRGYRFVKTSKPDLVHLNSSALAPSAIGAKLAGVPVIWHVREPIHHGYFGIRRWLLRQCIHRVSDRVIAISKHDARQLVQSDKIRIVYNFVDFKEFDRGISGDSFRREFTLNEGVRVVGMLGGVSMTKGTLGFVKAAKIVRDVLDNVKLFIVGNYPRVIEHVGIGQGAKEAAKRILGITGYYQKIRAFIEREGLREEIVFTGVRRDIPNILAGLDLVVFPSTVPHSARPIIEAGTMAKPVVASDLEGPRELVVDGETGLLVPPKNPEALANAIIAILSDEELARRMGEAGYRRARQLFNAEVNAQKTFEVYEEVFAEQARKRARTAELGRGAP